MNWIWPIPACLRGAEDLYKPIHQRRKRRSGGTNTVYTTAGTKIQLKCYQISVTLLPLMAFLFFASSAAFFICDSSCVNSDALADTLSLRLSLCISDITALVCDDDDDDDGADANFSCLVLSFCFNWENLLINSSCWFGQLKKKTITALDKNMHKKRVMIQHNTFYNCFVYCLIINLNFWTSVFTMSSHQLVYNQPTTWKSWKGYVKNLNENYSKLLSMTYAFYIIPLHL